MIFYVFRIFLLTYNSCEWKNTTYKKTKFRLNEEFESDCFLCIPKRLLPCKQCPWICSRGKREKAVIIFMAMKNVKVTNNFIEQSVDFENRIFSAIEYLC